MKTLTEARASSLIKWANILAFVLMVFVGGLAGSTTLLGGKTQAEISDANLTLITPAGFAFSIWGMIYVLLGIFVIFQALPGEKEKGISQENRMGFCSQ